MFFTLFLQITEFQEFKKHDFETFTFETFRKDCLQEKHIHAFESESVDVVDYLKRQFVSIRMSINVDSRRYG